MKTILISTALANVLTWLPCAALGQESYGLAASNNKYSATLTSRDSIPPVVVQFSPAERGKVEMMEEDLSVMTRLLEKNLERGLGEETVPYKMNIPLLVTSGGRSARAMYAEGLGALFMVKLNLPLVSPPKGDAKKPEPDNDSEWDRIRKEMQVEEEGSGLGGTAVSSDYDSGKVESLKTLLLQTLKHASHIRGLRPDEFVGVSVFGSDSAGGTASATSPTKVSSSKRKASTANATPAPGQPPEGVKDSPNSITILPAPTANVLGVQAVPATAAPGGGRTSSGGRGNAVEAPAAVPLREAYVETGKRVYGRGSVLTMRVKKEDVDAFAKGELDFDAFKKRTTLNTYNSNGYGVTSLNSWIQSGRPKASNRQ